jgi:hypothetical protein
MTPIASAGDWGATNGLGFLNVNYPASDPFVLSVGGTSAFFSRVSTVDYSGTPPYSTGGGRIFESAWSWSLFNGWGTGGGLSEFFEPTIYQYVATGVFPRGVPDVSAVADPETGVFIVYYGYTGDVGGTSVGAPEWAGMVALFDTALSDMHLGTAGAIANAFYYDYLNYPSTYASDWYDVLVGNNQGDFPWWYYPDQPVGYNATTGYDLVTGLGTPNLGSLIPDTILGYYYYPHITVTPAQVFANGTKTDFNINGYAFTPSGNVEIYISDYDGLYSNVWYTTAGSDGTFVFNSWINWQPGDYFYFFAYDEVSGYYTDTAVVADLGQLFLNSTTAHEGSHVLLQGKGFFPGEWVNIYPGYLSGHYTVGANSTGGFSLVLTVPALLPSTFEIFTWGYNSVFGMTSLYIMPSITLTPSTGQPGSSFQVTGWSFNFGSWIDLYLNNTYEGYIYADGNGDFTATLSIPTNAPPKSVYVVTAWDWLNYNATALFHVTGHSTIASAQASSYYWLSIPKGGSMAFKTNSTGGTTTQLKMLLSGSGTVTVSLGTSAYGTTLYSTTLAVSGAGWYVVTPPGIAFSPNTTYYLTVKPTSGSVSWAYQAVSSLTYKLNIGKMYYYFGSSPVSTSIYSFLFSVNT